MQASFAAGCFWGVEAKFSRLPGVKETMVGYMGGQVENPSYEQVCTHTTGHAETLQLEYDPKEITYQELLNFFWSIHNPKTLNKQGRDIGPQYRSVIFYHTEEQRQAAENSKKSLQEKETEEIVTEIVPATIFYRAEEYHQRYLEKHRG